MQNAVFKRSERGRPPMYLEYDYHSLFHVNAKISILVKTWFLKTYYLSNSFLQSQARKCSCSHSLRLYMFHCLDTGLDNSHQCLKKNTKDVVRINHNKTSISTNYRTHTYTRFTCRINWRHSVLFHKSTTQWKFFWN